MIIISGWLQIATFILLLSVAIKVFISIHWPWGRCACCGRKWSVIRRQQKQEELQQMGIKK